MAEIKGFKGLRYTEKAGNIEELCCPPYDIISDGERKQFLLKNPCNIIRLELPQSLSDNSDFDAYATAGGFLRDWISKGILKNDETDSIYVYEMEFLSPVNSQTYRVKGFVSMVKIEEFSKGVVLPHEETLSKAKSDRFNLMTATKCNFSQIYSLYMDEEGGVYETIEKASLCSPTEEFTDRDKVIHRLWKISDKDIIQKVSQLMQTKKVYIADGHHRYETALNYRNSLIEKGGNIGTSEYVPMMLVNMENEGLLVFPTHRIVKGLSNFNYDKIVETCREYFDITQFLNREKGEQGLENAYLQGKKAFVMYTGDNNYTLLVLKDLSFMNKYMPNDSDALKALDVSVLHTLVLERILGIDKANMANQLNLTYTKIADEAVAEVDARRANCSFLLNPTRVSEIREVALAGEKMPQKSTYFYPKLTTGLVMNQILGDS